MRAFLFLCALATAVGEDTPWKVGIGIADCTGPAAEVVMMGYAKNEHKTAGIHMRLYARAFIFEDPESLERVAFVNVDTWAATEAVIQGVERKLGAWFRGRYYNRNNLIVAGSHTHHSPAGASAYVLFQFTSMGKVQQSLDALVDGISEAVWLAHHNMKSAYVYLGSGMVDNSTVPGCDMPNCASRNRSPTSFLHNPEEEREKYFGGDNVDRNMDLIKIVDATTGEAMGLLNWYGVHPTSMTSDYNLISGDNKGYAAYAYEQMMNGPTWERRAGIGPFVAAFAQGVSGDVSPNTRGAFCKHTWESCENRWSVCWENGQPKNELCMGQGPGKDKYESMKIIGDRQKQAAKTIFDRSSTKIGAGVGNVLRFVDMSKYWYQRNTTWVQTCEPCLGTAFAAGTSDGPSGVNEFGQNMTPSNGFLKFIGHIITIPRAEDKICQAPKEILLKPNTIKDTVFPTVLGFQLIRIGDLVIAAVPGEFTTMAGKRTREAIKKVLVEKGTLSAQGTVVMNNVASGYAGYVTTLEEYQHQRYEGGFTTFGPNTHEAFTDVLVKMAEDMADGVRSYPGMQPQLPHKVEEWEMSLNVLVDDPPIGGSFGQVKHDVHVGPHWPGGRVRCQLWGAHPRNNLKRNSSFGTVWRWHPENASNLAQGGEWQLAADDGDYDTMFEWKREGISASVVTLSWSIPAAAVPGWYTMRYNGHAKHGGSIRPIRGACGLFEVRAAESYNPGSPEELVVPPVLEEFEVPPAQHVEVPDIPIFRRERVERPPRSLRGS